MEFSDEDAFEPRGAAGGPPRHYGAPDRHRQILVRRAVALGVGVLLLILAVLGVKGCLNARKERGFENYASDLSSAVAQTKQLSTDFFEQLSSPGKLSETGFEAQISADRGTAEGLLTNVENLDTPDELKSAQSELILAYTLRRDALAGIAENMPKALGTQNRAEAVDAIANYMKYFLASDVLFARAQSDINSVLSDEGIELNGKPAKVPDSVFLTDPGRWLDPLQVGTALAAVAGARVSGIHGVELASVTVKPGNVALSTDTPVTVSGSGPYTLDVSVSNGGDSEESDVLVSAEVTGGPETISGEATIPKIAAGGTQIGSIALQPSPPSGQQVSVQVTVQPVPGEQLTTNNTATYQVTFGG